MKRLLLIISIFLSFNLAAQRDINHWQLSAMGGGFYFDEELSEELEELESPGYYTLGLRIQKRIGLDFQVGISFLENRLRDNKDISERLTDLHVSYHWDNDYLLDQRSTLAPYHLLGVGFRTSGSSDELNLGSSRGIVNLENGIKARFGDNWSGNIAFIINWTGEDETFDGVFSEGYSYGFAAGISYHFGKVQTNYQAPVFNAGMKTTRRSEELFFNYTYITLRLDLARNLGERPELTVDSLKASRTQEITNHSGKTVTVQRGDSLFQLMGKKETLDSLYRNNKQVFRISMKSFNDLKSPATERKDKASDEKTKKEGEELLDKQNRLIENQNEFIKLMLSERARVESLPRDTIARDTSAQKYFDREFSDEFMFERDSLENEIFSDTNSFRRVNSVDTLQRFADIRVQKMEERIDKLESENQRLREEKERVSSDDSKKISDDDLAAETRRRNDLLEEQIDATRQLAEKSSDPTEVVVEDKRDDGKFNVQPSVVLPLGGNRANRDNRELLENQKRLEKRIDSLTYVISRMRYPTNRSSRADITTTATIGPSKLDTVARDSSKIDTLTANSEMDTTIAISDSLRVDSLSKNEAEEQQALEEMEVSDPSLTEELINDTTEIGEPKIESDQVAAKEESSKNEKELFMAYPVSIYYGLNSATLSTEGEKKLKEVAVDLKDFPNKSVSLEGHTDKSGNTDYNKMLSKKRAETVKAFLIENGVQESRISINPNGSEKARETYNKEARRVDVILD